MGIIDLIRIAFSGDDEIFLPLDNEYKCTINEGRYIWEKEVKKISFSNIDRIKEIISNGLPNEPEGEAPKFELNNRE